MALTDTSCKNAKCLPDKPRTRFADAGGLYLAVAATGESTGTGSTDSGERRSGSHWAAIHCTGELIGARWEEFDVDAAE